MGVKFIQFMDDWIQINTKSDAILYFQAWFCIFQKLSHSYVGDKLSVKTPVSEFKMVTNKRCLKYWRYFSFCWGFNQFSSRQHSKIATNTFRLLNRLDLLLLRRYSTWPWRKLHRLPALAFSLYFIAHQERILSNTLSLATHTDIQSLNFYDKLKNIWKCLTLSELWLAEY